MKKIQNNIQMFLWMTFLTGIIYPLLITGIAQITMKQKANGGLLYLNDRVLGATLIAQKFENDKYFWGRPSSTDYNPLPSGGSNLGPTSKALEEIVEKRLEKIVKAHEVGHSQIPTELLFASGSGLDPHISVTTAYFQLARVAKARGINAADIRNLVDKMIIKKSFGFIGETYVNVLLLNQALDNFYR